MKDSAPFFTGCGDGVERNPFHREDRLIDLTTQKRERGEEGSPDIAIEEERKWRKLLRRERGESTIAGGVTAECTYSLSRKSLFPFFPFPLISGQLPAGAISLPGSHM